MPKTVATEQLNTQYILLITHEKTLNTTDIAKIETPCIPQKQSSNRPQEDILSDLLDSFMKPTANILYDKLQTSSRKSNHSTVDTLEAIPSEYYQ